MFVKGANSVKIGINRFDKQQAFFYLATFLLAIQITKMAAILYTGISIDSYKLHTIWGKKQTNHFSHMGIFLAFGYVANR